MPSKSIINAVLKTARSLPDWPSLHVLDLSCGDGYLLEALRQEGCQVEGTHYRSDDYIYQQPAPSVRFVSIHKGVDLTEVLPFADATYDLVIATEVLEHLPSHAPLCAQVGRILKPGGHFIFSTPNIHRLHSRLQFMLTGQHELRSARLCWDTPPGALYTTHHNPVYFPTLHTVLHHHGLHIEKLAFSDCKPVALLLAPLYPLICIATAIETRHAFRRSRSGARDLLRWLVDYRLLFSNQLVVSVRKSDPHRAKSDLRPVESC